MTAPRYNQAAKLLPNGKVLVAGGGNIGAIYSSAELYDDLRSNNSRRTRHLAGLDRTRPLSLALYTGEGKN